MENIYKTLMARRLFWLISAGLLIAVVLIVDILVGPAFLGIREVVQTLLFPSQADRAVEAIVYSIRLPMSLMALFVGAALGLAGTHMQTILGNPLASPYTLGFSAAAGFGAALAIITGYQIPVFPNVTIPTFAFLAASLAALIVYGFARLKGMSPEIMVLAGIATLFLFQSMQSMVQYVASPEVLQEIVFWLFGSMLKANWSSVPITASLTVIGILLLLPDTWKLTALRLGDERARSIGVNVKALRIKVFAVVVLLTAGAVSFVGTIGFVGLVAPHIARMLVGEDQRVLLPMSAICGATIMCGASILSKLLSPGTVIPIGIVTAVIGVPFLFLLILRSKRSFW